MITSNSGWAGTMVLVRASEKCARGCNGYALAAAKPPPRPATAAVSWTTSSWILVPKPAGDGRGAGPQRGVRPDVLRWPATNRSAAGGSHGDQEVFDTDGVLFDKAELQETMVAGTTLRPVDDGFTLDVILQQLGVGHWHLGSCMSPAAYFVSSWLMIR